METTTREAQIEADIYKRVQRRFAEFDDPAHGWEHIKRVYQLALHIAEQEDADRFIDEARRRNPLDPSVPLGPLIQVMTAPGG